MAGGLPNVVPAKGYIPDEKTAIRVALAILEPVYGKKLIDREEPFRATLQDGVWVVEGTLHKEYPFGIQSGGTAIVEIDARSGRIVRMIHEK